MDVGKEGKVLHEKGNAGRNATLPEKHRIIKKRRRTGLRGLHIRWFSTTMVSMKNDRILFLFLFFCFPVSTFGQLPTTFEPGRLDFQTGKIVGTSPNVRWAVPIGSPTYATPVIAQGKVLIGTLNDAAWDKRRSEFGRSVLICFDDKTGEFHWQLPLPKDYGISSMFDAFCVGISSTPTVVGDRVFLTTGRGEVLCLDINGLANGNSGPYTDEAFLYTPRGTDRGRVVNRNIDVLPLAKTDADIIWRYDMFNELKSMPHDTNNCNIIFYGGPSPNANGMVPHSVKIEIAAQTILGRYKLVEVGQPVPLTLTHSGDSENPHSTIVFNFTGTKLYFGNTQDRSPGTLVANGQHYPLATLPPIYVISGEVSATWDDVVINAMVYSPSSVQQNNPRSIYAGLLVVNTGNAPDSSHRNVVTPSAPSLIIMDAERGIPLARDNFNIGSDISHGQWCSPAFGKVDGKDMIFYGGGNGVLHAVEAPSRETLLRQYEANGRQLVRLEPKWKFQGDPRAHQRGGVVPPFVVPPFVMGVGSPSYTSLPPPLLDDEGRIFMIFGHDAWNGARPFRSWLACINAQTGELIWGTDNIEGGAVAPLAIADGLLYMADRNGNFYCFDPATGKEHWKLQLHGDIWARPLIADGKIYIGTDRRMFYVLKAGLEPQIISEIAMPNRIFAPAAASGNTLYVAGDGFLYAVE